MRQRSTELATVKSLQQTEQNLTFTSAVFKSSTKVCFGWEVDALTEATSSRRTAANCSIHVNVCLIRARGKREEVPEEPALLFFDQRYVRAWKGWYYRVLTLRLPDVSLQQLTARCICSLRKPDHLSPLRRTVGPKVELNDLGDGCRVTISHTIHKPRRRNPTLRKADGRGHRKAEDVRDKLVVGSLRLCDALEEVMRRLV